MQDSDDPQTKLEAVSSGKIIVGDSEQPPRRTPTPSDTIKAGDQITLGDIGNSVVAAGEGAQALVNNIDTYVERYIERALTEAEQAEQARAMEHKRLAQAVKTYIQGLARQAGEAREAAPTTNPYKYVHAYELADASRFAGRDALAKVLLDQMVCSDSLCRFVVLDGRTKVGKTSLLRAGIVPALVAAEHLPLYVNMTPSPTGSLATLVKETLLPDLSATPLLAEAPLRVFINQVADLLPEGKHVFVLLDQFEATLALPEEALAAFRRGLAASLVDDDPRDHWLIGIDAARTSELNQLFQPTIAYPLANTLKVPFLSRNEARAAIVEPARRYGFSYDEELVDALLDDLGDDMIDPSYLQVLCFALIEAQPRGETHLALKSYGKLGGAAGVMGAHLDRTMEHMLPSNREAGWQILAALSDVRDGIAMDDELASRLRIEGLRENEMRRALEQLDTNGLLREHLGKAQLANEHFVPRIRAWAREWTAQRAVSEHIRTEFRRQVQYIVGSALRGTIGGAFGFGLAFWLAFFGQGLRHMLLLTLFRVLPGALAGVITIIASDVAMASYAGKKARWLPWLWGGGGGALGFGLALAYHFLFFSPSAYSNSPWKLLLSLVPAAIEGALWGLVTGLGIVWVRGGERHWEPILLKLMSASAVASLVLWSADAVVRQLADSGILVGNAFVRPEPRSLLFLVGAVMPLFVMAAALLPDLKLRRETRSEGDES